MVGCSDSCRLLLLPLAFGKSAQRRAARRGPAVSVDLNGNDAVGEDPRESTIIASLQREPSPFDSLDDALLLNILLHVGNDQQDQLQVLKVYPPPPFLVIIHLRRYDPPTIARKYNRFSSDWTSL